MGLFLTGISMQCELRPDLIQRDQDSARCDQKISQIIGERSQLRMVFHVKTDVIDHVSPYKPVSRIAPCARCRHTESRLPDPSPGYERCGIR